MSNMASQESAHGHIPRRGYDSVIGKVSCAGSYAGIIERGCAEIICDSVIYDTRVQWLYASTWIMTPGWHTMPREGIEVLISD